MHKKNENSYAFKLNPKEHQGDGIPDLLLLQEYANDRGKSLK
jgi:hypothetical protein